MLALFRPLCWCFMPWLYSGLYTEGLYHGFILGFILGFMSLGRGVSVASVASGAVLATAGAHRGATPQLGNSGSIRKLYCHRNSILGVVQGGRSTPGYYSALFFALYMLYTPLRVCISVCLYSTQSIAKKQLKDNQKTKNKTNPNNKLNTANKNKNKYKSKKRPPEGGQAAYGAPPPQIKKYLKNKIAFLTTLFCFIFVFIPVLYAGKSWALFRRSCWVVQKLQQLLILAYSVFIRVIRKNNSCLFCFILLYSGFF